MSRMIQTVEIEFLDGRKAEFTGLAVMLPGEPLPVVAGIKIFPAVEYPDNVKPYEVQDG